MDIYELRRKINVYNHGQQPLGASIFYKVGDRHGSMSIDNETIKKELTALGSIDEDYPLAEIPNIGLSQWEAINIAIRFELARQQEKDIEKADVFTALGKLINPNHGQGNAY